MSIPPCVYSTPRTEDRHREKPRANQGVTQGMQLIQDSRREQHCTGALHQELWREMALGVVWAGNGELFECQLALCPAGPSSCM